MGSALRNGIKRWKGLALASAVAVVFGTAAMAWAGSEQVIELN